MTTTVTPVERARAGRRPRSSAIRTPASRHLLARSSRCQSTANHSMTASAMTGPTPSTAASSSTGAARCGRGRRARGPAPGRRSGPTCRIDSATITRHSGRDLAASSSTSSFSALAVSTRSPSVPARVKNRLARSWSAVRPNTSPSSATTPSSSSATAALNPSPSMSSGPARGDVEHPLAQLRRARPLVGAADVDVALLGRAPAACRTTGSASASRRRARCPCAPRRPGRGSPG